MITFTSNYVTLTFYDHVEVTAFGLTEDQIEGMVISQNGAYLGRIDTCNPGWIDPDNKIHKTESFREALNELLRD